MSTQEKSAAENLEEINRLLAKKLDLFVKVRELHTEITKVNMEMLRRGADANMINVCW